MADGKVYLGGVIQRLLFLSCEQVLDVSGAGVLADNIPGCRVDFLENCGHSVVMERPRKSAKLLLEFSNWLQSRKLDSSSSKKLA